MNELALIPKHDWDDFGALPPHVKEKFRKWAKAIHELNNARNDGKRPGDVAKTWAARLKVTAKAVFSMRSLFNKDGWVALVDKRDAGPAALSGRAWDQEADLNLPPLAVEYLKKLFGDYKRKNRTAARAFVRQWERWERGDLSAAIPGLAECPKCGPSGEYPAGWSVRNLCRYLPSKFELAAERRGQNYAVGKCGPQIFTTRARLHYMSHVEIDDVWHDNFVVHGRQICRVLELDALDVFSGALVTWGTKPRLKREDGSQDTALAKYVPLVLAGLFSMEGYSPRGTEILAEHGTAALSDRVKKLLHDATWDGTKSLITVRESGITGEEQAIIGWRGKGKGNSRFKAAKESHGNLVHNELAFLPSQTGLSRDTRPEFTVGMLEDDDDLLKAIAVLAKKNPDRAAQLRTRTLDYHSAFLPLLTEIYRIINAREWHALEGWDDIPGNVQIEYRLAPTADVWLSDEDFQRLPATAQAVVLAAAAEDKRYLRRRRISPAEVQRRDRGGLLKLPDWVIAELIGFEFADERKVAGAYFNLIHDDEISKGELRFESQIVTRDGSRQQLADGKYLCVLNPFCPSCLFVHDAQQRFLGVARRDQRIDRTEDQLRHAYSRQAKRLNELTAPLIARHEADIKAETRRLKENADVIKGQNDEETAMDRKLARRARKEESDLSALGSTGTAARADKDGVTMEELNEL